MIPVILSGGSGSRLWPRSRQLYPKQFLNLTSDATLVQATVSRLKGLEVAAPLVVCNCEHRFIVAGQLHEIGTQPSAILLEPHGRNTAPAVALAALESLQQHEDPLLLVLPADHVINDVTSFHTAVRQAAAAAEAGALVTFGVAPTRAETGYGYIHRGEPIRGLEAAYKVQQFVEKPGPERAADFASSGEHFWNSGMFLFKASAYVAALTELAPSILKQCQLALEGARQDLDFTWLDADAFAACPSDSIDYAIMEKSEHAVMVPLDAGWSDIGSWESLWAVLPKDEHGNSTQGDVLSINSRNCLISAEKSLIAAVDVEDLVIVASDDAILVTRRESSQQVKQVVEELDRRGCSRHRHHRKVFRPWGHYDSLDYGERFQVKRICVQPGERLSLQKHHHRAEHWVVVRGTALVTCGDKEVLLTENQSTFIPLGVVHRLENPGKVELEIIEVQSGSYLGEDDIVRYDDVYGRKE